MVVNFDKNWLEQLVAPFIVEQRGGYSFGLDGRLRVRYVIDLLSAAHHDQSLLKMTEALSSKVSGHPNLGQVSAIIGPKRGNCLLVHEVSKQVGKPSGFVRQGILFGKWIEGVVAPGERVIVIDDVASDGEMLRDSVYNLRRVGVYTDAVIVLVDRAEGDAAYHLKKEGVDYQYVFQTDDEHLARIHRQFPAG